MFGNTSGEGNEAAINSSQSFEVPVVGERPNLGVDLRQLLQRAAEQVVGEVADVLRLLVLLPKCSERFLNVDGLVGIELVQKLDGGFPRVAT